MEEQFQLKYHGNLSIFEQNQMTAEERSWFLKRLSKEFKDRKDKEEAQARSAPRPRMPSRPPRPSIPRR
jgi:hypothetical protein